MAERQEARQLRALTLKTLIERHARTPEAALPHARALVGVDVDDVSAHVALLRILLAGGRQREAEEQREVSARLLAEAGGDAVQALAQAWRSLTGRPETVSASLHATALRRNPGRRRRQPSRARPAKRIPRRRLGRRGAAAGRTAGMSPSSPSPT